MTAGGRHFIVEFRDCNADQLNNEEFLRNTLVRAAETARCTVLHTYFHQFEPYGITGVIVLAESHITIHSWCEHNYAAVDIFMCSNKDPQDALEVMMDSFDYGDIEVRVIERK